MKIAPTRTIAIGIASHESSRRRSASVRSTGAGLASSGTAKGVLGWDARDVRYVLGEERQRVEVLDQPLAGPVPVAGACCMAPSMSSTSGVSMAVDRRLADVAVQRPLVSQ